MVSLGVGYASSLKLRSTLNPVVLDGPSVTRITRKSLALLSLSVARSPSAHQAMLASFCRVQEFGLRLPMLRLVCSMGRLLYNSSCMSRCVSEALHPSSARPFCPLNSSGHST